MLGLQLQRYFLLNTYRTIKKKKKDPKMDNKACLELLSIIIL